jgi:hypothetical protein
MCMGWGVLDYGIRGSASRTPTERRGASAVQRGSPSPTLRSSPGQLTGAGCVASAAARWLTRTMRTSAKTVAYGLERIGQRMHSRRLPPGPWRPDARTAAPRLPDHQRRGARARRATGSWRRCARRRGRVGYRSAGSPAHRRSCPPPIPAITARSDTSPLTGTRLPTACGAEIGLGAAASGPDADATGTRGVPGPHY